MSVMEGVCNGEESELTVQACVLSEFSESAEARALFNSLPDIHHDTASREAIIEKFVGERAAQSQVLCHCIRLIFHSKASAAAPNTITPSLFEMHKLPAERSAHDIKAQRERSKSTRSGTRRIDPRCSDASQTSLPLTIADVSLLLMLMALRTYIHLYKDGDYDRAAISSI
ncbi:hypothetical protein DPX16_8030 [Anabarilius grahami]|uniref:Uncharacterized protein n=1 Tax=Anabarilius grahami TaxID=495550 RepID=A0A3N0Z542_ANAGA|nr:hypothetical protein DPX16_8030 [Anabarilius grahami]